MADSPRNGLNRRPAQTIVGRVMKLFRRNRRRFWLAHLSPLVLCAALGLSGRVALVNPALAQAKYPDRPVRFVVPFAAGGVADSTARIVADKLAEKLGQRFYVENQPGAGGITAARTALSSAPDGHTLIMLTNGTAVSVSLFEKLPFDPVKDFTPVSSLRILRFRVRHQRLFRLQDAHRIHRRRQGQAGRAQCRHHQCRQHAKPFRRTVQDRRQYRLHARTVSRQPRG